VFRITTARGLGARHRVPPFRWSGQEPSPKGVSGEARWPIRKSMLVQLLDNAYATVITQVG
jgi:hypothetical protein